MCIAISRFNLDNIAAHFKHRDVKGPAAEVEYGNLLVLFFIKSIGERSRGRFIDDALHVETGNLPSSFGCAALVVVEVGGNGNDCLGNLLAELRFSIGLQFAQDHRRDFF